MTDLRRGHPITRGVLLLLTLALALAATPRVVGAADSAAGPIDLHLTGVVVRGPDAGIRMDGFLTLSPATGVKVAGSFSTFAGTLMSRLSSYTPIPVAGKVGPKSADLTFDLSAMTAAGASGNGAAGPMLAGMAQPHFAHLGAHSTLHGAGGHTHMTMLRRHGDALVINPGSISENWNFTAWPQEQRFNPHAEYAMVESAPGETRVTFHCVPIDVCAVTRAAHQSGMPDVEQWLALWVLGSPLPADTVKD